MTSGTLDLRRGTTIFSLKNGTPAVFSSSILAADNPAAAGFFSGSNIILFALLALLIFMMLNRQKKTKAAAQKRRSQLAPGVEMMTNFGLFGKVISIDEEENKIVLEISPGTTATVHRQTVAKIIEPEDAADAGGATAAAPEATATGGAASATSHQAAPHDAVPNDASSLTVGLEKRPAEPETAAETLERLQKENNKDN